MYQIRNADNLEINYLCWDRAELEINTKKSIVNDSVERIAKENPNQIND